MSFSLLGLKLVVFGQVDLSMENLAKKANRMLALHMEQTHWRCLFKCESTLFWNESLFCTSYFLCNDPVWTYFFPKDRLHLWMYSVNLQLQTGEMNLCLCSSMYIGMESLRENKVGCWDDWSCNQIKVPAVLQSLPWGRCDWSNMTIHMYTICIMFEFPPLTGKDFLLCLWLSVSKKNLLSFAIVFHSEFSVGPHLQICLLFHHVDPLAFCDCFTSIVVFCRCYQKCHLPVHSTLKEIRHVVIFIWVVSRETTGLC